MVLAMRATGAKGLGLPPRTAGLGSRRSSRASRETRLRARAAVGDFIDQLEVVGTLRELPRSAEALVASAVDAVPLPSEGLEQGWGLELLREVLLQAAFKVASYAPEGSLPDWDVVERTLAANASATPHYTPIGIISSFSLLLGAMAFASLNEVDGGSDEWSRLAAEEGEEEPEELKIYDPEVAKSYFLRRPSRLIRRGWRSSLLLGAWSAKLIMDAKLGRRPQDDEEKKLALDCARASELKEILIKLGPTYVKLGQVLSSRQDLLPAGYVQTLQALQDQVPPFSDSIARRMVSRELGPSAASRIEYIKESPVASASLGQVYECVDRETGARVAVKVQRPGALAAVSLDVAIIRLLGPILYKINDPEGNLDAKGLVDEWGKRFVDELDYTLEARNAAEFQKAMDERRDALGDSVFAPKVERGLSSRRILTAEWVVGRRIDAVGTSSGRICAITLAAYLAMLLETGCLHVDPHPGNLLVTDDDRVCILDWGLVTTVTKAQQEAILEFIAHLVSGNFDKIDKDLATMGFVPPEKINALNDAKLTRAIGVLFEAAAAGGGATGFRKELGFTQSDEELRALGKDIRKIKGKNKKETELLRRDAFIEMTGGSNSKVAQLSRDLEATQKAYGNIFTIPSYFAYILRAFSVLEGIGLASDGEYSLAQEAFPFVARRLLTDRSESSRRALFQLLYKDGTRMSVEKAKQLAEAFSTYSVTMSPHGVAAEEGNSTGLPVAVKEGLRVAFDPEGGPLQDVIFKEAARLAGATAASALEGSLALAFEEGGLLERQHSLQKASPLGELPLPPTPFEVWQGVVQPALESVASAGGTDEDATEIVRILSEAAPMTGGEPGSSTPALPELPSPEVAREALDLAIELAPGIAVSAARFGSSLLADAADRVGSAVTERQENQ